MFHTYYKLFSTQMDPDINRLHQVFHQLARQAWQ